MGNRRFYKLISLLLAFSLITEFLSVITPIADASSTPPTVAAVNLISGSFIEIDWRGTDYINGAGRSKEHPYADYREHFEIRLDGVVLAQAEPWYWNITNLLLRGVRVNQNKTTLRLARNLTSAQMAAVQEGSSVLDVRIVSDEVRASRLSLTEGGLNGSTPLTAIPPAAIGAPGARANTVTRHRVAFRPYYTNTILSRDGVPVRGSRYVQPATVESAVSQVDVILSAAPAPLITRLANTSQFVIFGPGEHSFNIPEHRSVFLRDTWSRAEGYGGNTSATSSAGVTRQHILPVEERTYPPTYATAFRNESILAHEFGHGIMNAMGNNALVNPGSPTHMRGEIEEILADVIRIPENPERPDGRLRWQGRDRGSLTYMATNAHDFAATSVSIWFDAMAESEWQNNGRGPVNTRDELRRYCTPTYNFFTRILPEERALSPAWGREIPNSRHPFFPPEMPDVHPNSGRFGRYGASVKLLSPVAENAASSGLQTYIPWNAGENFVPPVELWWDYDTDLMRWHLEPDADEAYFRIHRRNNVSYTREVQRGDLVLMPQNGNTARGTEVVLSRANNLQPSQWWRFVRDADTGHFRIVNRENPEAAIVLRNGSAASGTRIELGELESESAHWIVEGNVPLSDEEFCRGCGNFERNCYCEICETCEKKAFECTHGSVRVTRQSVIGVCRICRVEKEWRITIMTTFLCNAAVGEVAERRAARRSISGERLPPCTNTHIRSS
jgi:hypothetical protein